jgi:hypothetical protein
MNATEARDKAVAIRDAQSAKNKSEHDARQHTVEAEKIAFRNKNEDRISEIITSIKNRIKVATDMGLLQVVISQKEYCPDDLYFLVANQLEAEGFEVLRVATKVVTKEGNYNDIDYWGYGEEYYHTFSDEVTIKY